MDHIEFRTALRSLDLPQRQLAERLGVHVNTVNRWAKGADHGGLAVPQYAVYALVLLRERREIAERLLQG